MNLVAMDMRDVYASGNGQHVVLTDRMKIEVPDQHPFGAALFENGFADRVGLGEIHASGELFVSLDGPAGGADESFAIRVLPHLLE